METPQNIEVLAAVGTYDISYLEGRLLTVIDASIGDPEQRRALKDIIRQNVWSWYDQSPRKVEASKAGFIAEFPNLLTGLTGSPSRKPRKK